MRISWIERRRFRIVRLVGVHPLAVDDRVEIRRIEREQCVDVSPAHRVGELQVLRLNAHTIRLHGELEQIIALLIRAVTRRVVHLALDSTSLISHYPQSFD
jgi:hypothetical protein